MTFNDAGEYNTKTVLDAVAINGAAGLIDGTPYKYRQKGLALIGLWGVLSAADGHVIVQTRAAPADVVSPTNLYAVISQAPSLELVGTTPRFAPLLVSGQPIPASFLDWIATAQPDNGAAVAITLKIMIYPVGTGK